MLVRFEVANFRSIADTVTLSMVAVDQERPAAREQSVLGESLLTVAAIYGPNASGKSNIVAALAWLRDAVQDSLRSWDDEIPLEPFAFGSFVGRPSEFVLELAIDGVRFEYLLELDRERVHYEALFHYPEKKRRRIFEREGMELKLQRGLGKLSGTRELLTDKTLVLSAARRFGDPSVSGFANEFLTMRTMGVPRRRARGGWAGGSAFGPLGIHETMRWFQSPSDQPSLFPNGRLSAPNHDRTAALALLRLADLGIEDVTVDEEEISLSDSTAERPTRRRVRLVHRTGETSAPLDFHAESEGTRTWFRMIGPLLSALDRGSMLLFDELDASLHPTLSAEVLRLFHDPITNPRGAQLLFTSHDTSLLNHLNRDEVWLTEKRPDGSTRLGALAEFAGERVRKSQKLETAYLHGRFGALPNIDEAEMLRALGLAA